MTFRSSIAAMTLVTALGMITCNAQAFDDSTYPNFEGQWRPVGGPGRWDPTKLRNRRR
jgi:hypothetical protein